MTDIQTQRRHRNIGIAIIAAAFVTAVFVAFVAARGIYKPTTDPVPVSQFHEFVIGGDGVPEAKVCGYWVDDFVKGNAICMRVGSGTISVAEMCAPKVYAYETSARCSR